jgi:hypothetical protein
MRITTRNARNMAFVTMLMAAPFAKPAPLSAYIVCGGACGDCDIIQTECTACSGSACNTFCYAPGPGHQTCYRCTGDPSMICS